MPAPTPPPAVAPATPTPSTHHAMRSMELQLHGSADVAFPLFGPVREAEWAKGWAPRFVHPDPPASLADGAVFTTEGHHGTSVWVMTEYDSVARRVAYVVVQPERLITEIRIRVTERTAAAAVARVEYRWTALGAEGAEMLSHRVLHWSEEAPHWTSAVNERLAAITKGAHR